MAKVASETWIRYVPNLDFAVLLSGKCVNVHEQRRLKCTPPLFAYERYLYLLVCLSVRLSHSNSFVSLQNETRYI